jgi:hypothetical protein
MTKLTFNQLSNLHAHIAEQIWREQTLVSNRLSWNLTFQGFMIAGFALVATSQYSAPDQRTIQLIVTGAGFVVSFSTFLGILAAQRQSSFLKKKWIKVFNSEDDIDDPNNHEFYPRPFSDSIGSKLGRFHPLIICFALCAMWLALGFIAWGNSHALTTQPPISTQNAPMSSTRQN